MMRAETVWICAVAAFAVLAVPAEMSSGVGGILPTSPPPALDDVGVHQAYAALPLAFEANRGQVAPGPGFVARGSGYAFLVGPTGATLEFTPGGLNTEETTDASTDPPPVDVVRISLAGADPRSAATTGAAMGMTGSFLGSDPSRWRAAVPDYSRVVYHSVYPGIDLAFHGVQGSLEYDFLVAPGADPRQIRVSVDGAPSTVAGSGAVALSLPGGNVVQHPATVYQPPAAPAPHPHTVAAHPAHAHAAVPDHHRGRVEVGGGFSLGRGGALHLALGDYDATRPLVVDPLVTWSPQLGGGVDDIFVSAQGAHGDAYLVTATPSPGAADGGPAVTDIAVLHLDRAGEVLYRTFVSGDSDVSTVSVGRDGGIFLSAGADRSSSLHLGPTGVPLPVPRTGASSG